MTVVRVFLRFQIKYSLVIPLSSKKLIKILSTLCLVNIVMPYLR
jgi:hypothetical protein